MRHRKATLKLNRTSSHRSAMFRNMVTSLFKYERIKTTDIKAKALRTLADHIISLAKRGDLHARRQAMSIIREKQVVHKLFENAQKRFGRISGGYTRVLKLGFRPGDAAPISLIELFDAERIPKKKAPVKDRALQKEETPARQPDVEPAGQAKSADDQVSGSKEDTGGDRSAEAGDGQALASEKAVPPDAEENIVLASPDEISEDIPVQQDVKKDQDESK